MKTEMLHLDTKILMEAIITRIQMAQLITTTKLMEEISCIEHQDLFKVIKRVSIKEERVINRIRKDIGKIKDKVVLILNRKTKSIFNSTSTWIENKTVVKIICID